LDDDIDFWTMTQFLGHRNNILDDYTDFWDNEHNFLDIEIMSRAITPTSGTMTRLLGWWNNILDNDIDFWDDASTSWVVKQYLGRRHWFWDDDLTSWMMKHYLGQWHWLLGRWLDFLAGETIFWTITLISETMTELLGWWNNIFITG